MKRVLIVAYYFPPIGGIGSIRLARFAACLPEFGWEPTVLAPRETPHALDPQLRFPEEKVIRSRSLEVSRLGRLVPGSRQMGRPVPRQAGSGTGGGRPGILSLARSLVFYPDGQTGWYPGAVRSGLRALRRERFDAIYSSSYPVTAHLIARTLSRRSGLPWVAEFRDPWSERLMPGHPLEDHAKALAARLADAATCVIVPSPSWGAYYSDLWGRPVDIIPNGHDIEPEQVARPDRPTITHVGSYYPDRQNLRALWAAAAAVGGDIQVRFVGELASEVRGEIAESGVDVETTGFVPHDTAIRATQSSTVLVASGFDDGDPMSRGVIPAKLFEYLATSLPIIYFGEADDDAATLLRDQPGTHVVGYDDVERATSALRAALDADPVERDAAQFSRRSRARDLALVLDQAAGSGAR